MFKFQRAMSGVLTAFVVAWAVTVGQSPGIAQPAPPDALVAELIGATVFSAEGNEVGEVAAVAIGADGQISEMRITTASPLGLGTRTVILPHRSFITLQGAVVVELSHEEVDALPTVGREKGDPS
jgi:hypothetical protein